jgi:prepilin-type N-terminal cleavage/methylation domain-containing protein
MANSKNTSAFRKLKGFTLVELIVVITILAILGTIGFLAI